MTSSKSVTLTKTVYCCRYSLLGCIGTHIYGPKEDLVTNVMLAPSGERKQGRVLTYKAEA